MAKSATSCVRTVPRAAEPNASASGHRPGRSTARPISQRASVASGYASGSSTRIGAYAAQARRSRAPAAKSAPAAARACAARARTRGRSPRSSTNEDALDRRVRGRDGASHQTGAVSHGTRLGSRTARRAAPAWPVSAIARASCVSSSSSVKIVGDGAPRGLPRVERGEARSTRRGAGERLESGRARRSRSPGARRRADPALTRRRLESARAAELDVSRTTRCGMPAASQARHGVEPLRRRVGIVTSTSSARVAESAVPASSSAPTTRTPRIRRRRTRGLSSRNPTTRASSASAELAGEAAARRPAPATSTRLRAVVRAASASGTRRSASREAPTRTAAETASTAKISRGRRRGRASRATIPYAATSRIARAEHDGDDVARRRVAPDAPVDAERDEEDVRDAEQDRQRGEVDRRAGGPCRVPSTASEVAARNEPQTRTKSTKTSTSRRGSKTSARQSALGPPIPRRDAPRGRARKLPNWTRSDEGHEHADRGHAGRCRARCTRAPSRRSPTRRSRAAGRPSSRRARSRRGGATCGRGRPASRAASRRAARP